MNESSSQKPPAASMPGHGKFRHVARLGDVLCEALPGLMAGVPQLAVPLVVDVCAGANWEQAH
jgi:hypothetical protein